MVDNDTK